MQRAQRAEGVFLPRLGRVWRAFSVKLRGVLVPAAPSAVKREAGSARPKRCANLRCPRNGKRTPRVPAISRRRWVPRGLSICHCSFGMGRRTGRFASPDTGQDGGSQRTSSRSCCAARSWPC